MRYSSKTSLHAARLMLRAANTGLYPARELQVRHALIVYVRPVQLEINAGRTLNCQRMISASAIYAVHRKARMVWSREHIQKGGQFFASGYLQR